MQDGRESGTRPQKKRDKDRPEGSAALPAKAEVKQSYDDEKLNLALPFFLVHFGGGFG